MPSAKRTPKPKPEAASVLTFRQRLFVSYYLGDANGNATEAARMAGYAVPGVQGCENLAKPNIRAEIEAALVGPAMSADETLARISDFASADLGDFAEMFKVEEGVVVFDLKAAKAAGISHLLKSVKPSKYGMTVELHDAQAALEKLARFHRLIGTGAIEAGDGDASDAVHPDVAAAAIKAINQAADALKGG